MKIYAKARLSAAKRLEDLKESTLRHIANNPKDKRSKQAQRILLRKFPTMNDTHSNALNIGRAAAGIGSTAYGLYTGNPAAISLGLANAALGLDSIYMRQRAKHLTKKNPKRSKWNNLDYSWL